MTQYKTDEGKEYTGDREADKFAGEDSVAGKLRTRRQGQKARLDEIMGRKVEPTRQKNPPQTGRSRMDDEGNQDTLK